MSSRRTGYLEPGQSCIYPKSSSFAGAETSESNKAQWEMFFVKKRLNIPLEEKQLPEYMDSDDRLFESLEVNYCLLFKTFLMVIENILSKAKIFLLETGYGVE